MHSIVDGVEKLTKEYKLKGEEIEEIQVGGSKKLVAFSGIYEIDSAMAGQYSAPFVVALTMLGDIRNPKNFKKISNDERGKALKRIVMKTKLFIDDDLEKISPKTEGAKIIIKLKNGKTIETKVLHAKGHATNEMSYEEICEKFTVVTRDKIDGKKRNQIIDMIENLESVSNISSLVKLLLKKD